jgi:HD-GYP domain-containing protein (c-di-GMP phosphodiesterase class II)
LLHVDDLGAVESLAQAIDAKQKLPENHSLRVAELAVAAAAEMGLDEKQQADVHVAALLRDIAQLALPETILTKPEPLTCEERATVTSHPTVGHAIIQKAPHLRTLLPGILHHHERFDGTGYPAGLAGDKISLVGRIVAVADAYMMLIARRPTTPVTELRQPIAEGAGTTFDPDVVGAFQKVMDEKEQATDIAA